MKIAILLVSQRGEAVALRLKKRFPDAEIIGPKKPGLRLGVRRAFKMKRPIVFIGALGIATRLLAPFIRAKDIDPAVVSVDEKARFAISLLSGHLGGANQLAKEAAGALGAIPVITTATDLSGLPCAEDIAKRLSLAIENPRVIKAVNSSILEHKGVAIIDAQKGRRERIKRAFGRYGMFRFFRSFPKRADKCNAFVLISDTLGHVPPHLIKKTLVLRPKAYVAGIGCGRGVKAWEILKAYKKVTAQGSIPMPCIRNLATIDIKKDEKGLAAFAREMGLPIEFFSGRRLSRIKTPSAGSLAVMKNTGTGSVCEASAMLSSGKGRLCINKTRVKRVAIAVARVASR